MATSGNAYLQGLSNKAKEDLGLISGHAYSLIWIKQLGNETLVKLRNPWGRFVWKGKWSFNSPLWTPQLRKCLQYEKEVQDGTFYIAWKDYCLFYGDISICKMSPTYVHTSLRISNNKKKSNYIKMTVTTQGTYNVFICQESWRKYATDQTLQNSNSRLIIMKKEKGGMLTFISATNLAQEQIQPGVYALSAKVFWKNWNDHECFLTVYGVEKVAFQKMNRSIAPQFKQQMIESFATANKQNSQKGSFQAAGLKDLLTETYFSMEQSIGFIKTVNNSKRNIFIETTYQLKGLKIIKPKSNPYKQDLKVGDFDSWLYSFSRRILVRNSIKHVSSQMILYYLIIPNDQLSLGYKIGKIGYRIINQFILSSMEQDLSAPTNRFLAILKAYLSEGLQLKQYVKQLHPADPDAITLNDFIALTKSIQSNKEPCIQSNKEPLNANHIFFQLSKNKNVLTTRSLSQYLQKGKVQENKMELKLTKDKCQLGDYGRKLGEDGFNILCSYLLTHREKIERVFKDCEHSKLKAIDRNAFSRLLYASEIKKFQDKDMRRYLVTFLFNNIEGQSLTKEQFIKLFTKYQDQHHLNHHQNNQDVSTDYTKSEQKIVHKVLNLEVEHKEHPLFHSNLAATNNLLTGPSFLPFGLVLNVPKIDKTAHPQPKKVEENKVITKPIQPNQAKKNKTSTQDTLLPNKLPIHEENKTNISAAQTSKHPAHEQSEKGKQILNASDYFRLGKPCFIKYSFFLKQLQNLLTHEKEYFDPENPIAKARYTPVNKIFNSSNYKLFEQSPELMNRNRENIRIVRQIEAGDINQGQVGDCYFLSAVGSLAALQPQLIGQMFLFNVNPAGYYAIRLFIDGEWKVIKTDDLFPAQLKIPFYARPNGREIWVMLIQKAFSKVYGSYEAINGGTSEEAFIAITGAPTFTISIKGNNDIEELKRQTEQAFKNGYLMTAAFESESKPENGLINQHEYSLILIRSFGGLTFVKLRNPWGHGVWLGNWSFQYNQWTPQLRKQLQYEIKKEDGIFYMQWEDFCQCFDFITVCKINPTHFHSTYPMVNNKKKSNYVKMIVTTPGVYSLSVWQESRKHYTNDKDFTYSNSRIIVAKQGQNGELIYKGANNTSNKQVCNVDIELEAGTYVISAKVAWNKWEEHKCILSAYGVEKVNFELMERTIAPQFKQNIIQSFAEIKKKYADSSLYSKNGVQFITEDYFSSAEGLGFIKLTNKNKQQVRISLNFKMITMKLIKPATNPHVISLEEGSTEIVGFIVRPDSNEQIIYESSIQI